MDGGMGSQLIARGLQGGEQWNVERPEVVRAIHGDYRRAGAQVLLANTFGANRLSLARHGHEAQLEAFNRAGVSLAREAAGEEALVAGDIGPTGEFLEPFGEGTPDQFLEVFAEQARVLADAGADFLLIETMSDTQEMALAIQACRQACGLPIAASMCFDPAGDTFRTMMGKTPGECAAAMADAGADIVGTNCGTISPAQMAVIVSQMRAATDRPLLCECNAGAPEMVDGKVHYAQMVEEWLDGMRTCRDAGAQMLGGCCGTTPEHIQALARYFLR